MIVNTLNPVAYVQRIKIIAESNKQQITQSVVEKATLERSPNYPHQDGRIYASSINEPYFAVSVSPLNPEFVSQIEAGILPVVTALLEKHYLPISSCEGHGDSKSFVRIGFGSDGSADKFINEFGSMDYVSLKKLKTSANIIQWWENDKPRWRTRHQDEITNTMLESQDINLLYKRNYNEVCYVDINLYDANQKFWHFFKRYQMIKDIKSNKNSRIQRIRDRILSMEDYEL